MQIAQHMASSCLVLPIELQQRIVQICIIDPLELRDVRSTRRALRELPPFDYLPLPFSSILLSHTFRLRD